jgi:hypothetical protein
MPLLSHRNRKSKEAAAHHCVLEPIIRILMIRLVCLTHIKKKLESLMKLEGSIYKNRSQQ